MLFVMTGLLFTYPLNDLFDLLFLIETAAQLDNGSTTLLNSSRLGIQYKL
jgi:hypothetical protein